jgi:cobalamin biosynthetic protein CobC
LASCIAQWFGPWAVSGHALETGTAALDDAAWSGSMQTRLEAESQELAVLLARHGFEIAGRNALFVLARHANAISISEALAKAQILVRPFPDRPHQLRFGLPASGLARLDQALGAIMRSL